MLGNGFFSLGGVFILEFCCNKVLLVLKWVILEKDLWVWGVLVCVCWDWVDDIFDVLRDFCVFNFI